MKQNNTETFAFILVTASGCGTRVVKVTKLDVWSFSNVEAECDVHEGTEDVRACAKRWSRQHCPCSGRHSFLPATLH